ncbi:MAG: pyridoxal phosphate-dependent aminotransferase [Myxococcales bacterium]|nr:pyridoxal phosphate-dependent aminotransferase [Myxococcales bacterium]MCB9701710.1 pyridoxal phosphate-dependent aminotransferase [Myxococcales bacterium]
MTRRVISELPVNARAAAIRPSATLAVASRAGDLRAAGKEVLDFSAGEPDFPPPPPVGEAVAAMVATRPIHYAPVAGLPELRDVVAAELSEYHGQRFTRAEVMVNCGAKHSLAGLFLVTLEPGDEVIVVSPYWVSYPEMVKLAGGAPRIVAATIDNGWRVTPEALAAALGPRTRYVVLNSPSNPTGAGYREADLQALFEVIEARAPQAWILCDDIYRKLVYDGYEHVSAFRALAGRSEQVIVVDGVSKSHAMTGYRIGFLVAPAPIIAAVSRVQGQMTSGAATPSQVGALAALRDPRCAEAAAAMQTAFARRRALSLAALAAIPGLRVHPPEGAFYVFVDVRDYLVGGEGPADDVALATWLLERKLVATVPGTAFGAPGHLRISYATSDEALREGFSRIAEALAELPRGA